MTVAGAREDTDPAGSARNDASSNKLRKPH
jgi:hypothetical protein